MESNKLTEEELKEVQTLNEDKNRLTIDFGRVKTKGKKMMEKFNKKYGDGSINLDDGTFTPSKK